MEVYFINQDHGLPFKWIVGTRIRDSHTPGKIAYHRERALLAVGELIDDQFLISFAYYHSKRRSSYLEPRETGKEPFDGSSHGSKLRIPESTYVSAPFVLQILALPEPLKKNTEAVPLS